MELNVARQTIGFLLSILLGGSFGVLYDCFRVFRLFILKNPILVFIEDVLYFFICSVITFGFLIEYTDGSIRLYALAGIFFGAFIYYLTIGRIVFAAVKKIAAFIKRCLSFLLRPVSRLVRLLIKAVVFLFKKCLNSIRKSGYFFKKNKKTLENKSPTML